MHVFVQGCAFLFLFSLATIRKFQCLLCMSLPFAQFVLFTRFVFHRSPKGGLPAHILVKWLRKPLLCSERLTRLTRPPLSFPLSLILQTPFTAERDCCYLVVYVASNAIRLRNITLCLT